MNVPQIFQSVLWKHFSHIATAVVYLVMFLFVALVSMSFFATALDGYWQRNSMATVLGIGLGLLFASLARTPLRLFNDQIYSPLVDTFEDEEE